MLRPAALVASLTAALAAATPAPAAAPAATEIGAALRAPGVSPSLTGAVVLELESGEALYVRNGVTPLRPASTEKLVVAVAALDRLGPGFRIATVVLGDGAKEGATWRGDLVLKGFGDPSLHLDDLERLASQVRAAGIRRVTGRIRGDETFFDARRTAPGWKPSYYKNESAPLSALIVERAWRDGRQRDDPARAAAVHFTRELENAGIAVARRAASRLRTPSSSPACNRPRSQGWSIG